MKNDRSVIFTIVRVLFAFVTFFVLRIYAKKKGGTGKTFKNILFIISDDLRTDINSYGGPAKTPSLDKFAASPGTVQFDRAYVQQAICCPSRSSFLLGRRPDTTRVWDLKTQFRTSAHGAEHWETLPQFFRNKGYVTYGMGKVFHPVDYKNKTDDVAGGSWSTPYFHGVGGEDKKHVLNETNCGVSSSVPEDSKYTDGMLANHAVKTLRKAVNKAGNRAPFFVAVGFHRPHLPWIVPKKYFDMYPQEAEIKLADYMEPPKNYNITGAQKWSWDPQSGPRHCQPLYNLSYPKPILPEYGLVDNSTAKHFRRSYWAAVSQMDRNVGIVLDELDNLGVANTTVVLFAGDHGWQLGDLGEFGKKTNFERATRAPLLIRDPAAYKSGKKASQSSALVEFVDIMPTLIDLALGSEYVPNICPLNSSSVASCREGESLRTIMEGEEQHIRSAAFMQYAHCMHDDKIWHDACANNSEPHVMGYAIRTRRWRYVEWVKFDKITAQPIWEKLLGTELYDHTLEDIVENKAESVNVVMYPENRDIVKKLSGKLHKGWRGALKIEKKSKSVKKPPNKYIVVDNTKPRLDVNGQIINAHDGTYRKYGKYWYYHAMEYDLCHEPAKLGCDQTPDHCGFRNDHNVSIWRSKTLESGSWEKVGNAMECKQLDGCAIAYRPHLVYNSHTNKYVLFVNYVGFGNAYKGYAVYSSNLPEGPFNLENDQLNVTRLCPGPDAGPKCGKAQGGCGDFDIFVDDTDGRGYIVYGCAFYLSIERLTDNFYYSLGDGGNATIVQGPFGGTVFPDYFVEAPVFFKRNHLYYILYGHCCCFCEQGSGIIVATATNPMGPWTRHKGNKACVPAASNSKNNQNHKQIPSFLTDRGIPTPGQGCLYNGSTDVSTTKAQQNFVIEIKYEEDGIEKSMFVWTGDKWQQAPDKIKGHEGQFWAPLHFDGEGMISEVKYIEKFKLPTGEESSMLI